MGIKTWIIGRVRVLPRFKLILPMVPIGSFKISQFKHEQTRFGPLSFNPHFHLWREMMMKKNPIQEDIQRKLKY